MRTGRVVITGLGAVSPLGLSVQQMWEGLCSGRSGIDTIKAFDPVRFACKLAGEAPQYSIRDYVPKAIRKSTKLMSRDIELSVIAAKEAFESSRLVTKGIDPENVNVNPERMAINMGTGLIACDLEEIAPAVANSAVDGKFDMRRWGTEGMQLVTPLWLLKYLPNMLPCHVGIIHDIQGPSNTITCAESSALIAISEARQVVQRGDADIALAGGAEAKVNPIVMLRQILLKRSTVTSNDDPAGACRPFDADASGSVFGEGAGSMVLEDLDSATSRGAKIHAELVGCGESISLDPHYEKLEADGRGLKIAIEKAIDEAGIEPGDLGLIIPHGTGIPDEDAIESMVLEEVLGDAVGDVPVWPTKSMLSVTGAASGGLDLIAAVCAIDDGMIPAAKNCDKRAERCNLNIVAGPLQKDVRYALCCSYSYCGHTAASVVKKYEK